MSKPFPSARTSLRLAVVSLALIGSCAASAASIAYTSSAAFLAALSGGHATTETFESAALNALILSGSVFDGVTYTFNQGQTGRIDNTYNSFGSQGLAANGTPNFFDAAATITVSFGGPVNAFGLFFNAGVSPAGSFFVTSNLGNTALSSATYDIPTFYFVGLVSDVAFTSITFGGSGTANSGFNVDNLTFNRIPEPPMLALFALSLLAAVGARSQLRDRRDAV